MRSESLPGGGKPWFVRVKKRFGCGLKPVSVEGRALTGAYSVWVGAVTWFLVADDPTAPRLVAWLAILAASTFFFILTALRMSAPAAGPAR